MTSEERQELERLQGRMAVECGEEGAMFLRLLLENVYGEHSEAGDETGTPCPDLGD